MTLSPKDLLLVARMRKIGMKMPVRTLIAARSCGLSVPLACSILTQETSGGLNEWGHDPTIFVGGYDAAHKRAYGETVTEAAYLAYVRQRNLTGKCQGVGPCQLTSKGFQDAADKQGGCWKPLVNMKVGFASLAATIRRDGLRPAIVGYNGSGPAAEAYANTVLARANKYAVALKLPAPK